MNENKRIAFLAAFAPRFSKPATIILTTAASFAASSATAMAIGRIPVAGKFFSAENPVTTLESMRSIC